MPYFFTKMVKEGGIMEAVWPEDGAIISPIFMLTKREKLNTIKPIIDLFASVSVGEILSHKGLFPSTIPEVDNKLSKNSKFQWIGWDYIYKNNIGKKIEACNDIFNKSVKKEVIK
jgi:ABC-type Fe3+ transport system substrate-binding protein